jgi:sulfite reductase (NADPH) flavoprotein alpha-component
MNIVPETAPFSREQRAWLNGFLAASLFDRLGSMPLGAPPSGSPSPAAPPRSLWVGYGSQSGSASGLAKKLAKLAESKGFVVTLRELNQITPEELAAQERLLVVTQPLDN